MKRIVENHFLKFLSILLLLVMSQQSFINACPIALSFNSTDAICPNADGGARVLVAGGSGDYTYLWMPGGANTDTIGMLNPGTYVVTVMDTTGGCMAVDSVTILGDSIAGFAGNDTICVGGNTTLFAVGPSSGAFVWSGGDLTSQVIGTSIPVSPATTQTYTLSWFNGPTCADSVFVTVFVADIQATVTPVFPNCGLNNGSISVSNVTGSSGPYTYTFQQGVTVLQTGPNSVLNNLTANTYLVTTTDQASGCTYFESVTLTDNSFPMITNIIYTNQTQCCDDTTSAILVVTGGSGSYNFSWLHDAALTDSIAPGLLSGTQYTVEVFDPACAAPLDTTITIPGPSSCIDVTVDTVSDNCAMGIGSATLQVTGGVQPYSFVWSTGSTDSVITGLTAGGYTVVIRDSLQCAVVASAQINDPGGPRIDTAFITCEGFGFGDIAIQASGIEPLTYVWSHDTINAPIDTNLPTGNYIVIVYDSTGCPGPADTFTIAPFDQTILELGEDTTIAQGQQISIEASTTIDNWVSLTWAPDEDDGTIIALGDLAYVRPDSTTTYLLSAINEDGCLTVDSITVFVDQEELTILFPNIFTPNNDGLNDFFFLLEGADKINNIEFQVYDRWGNRVIEIRDPNFRWDGRNDNGDLLSPGVYVYYLRYETFFEAGKQLHISGDLTLIR